MQSAAVVERFEQRADAAVGGAVRWEQQQRHLWVGRRDGMPVGTVERGRRYSAIDQDGAVLRRCATLAEAQGSFDPDVQAPLRGAEPPSRRLLAASTAAAISTSAFTLTALFIR